MPVPEGERAWLKFGMEEIGYEVVVHEELVGPPHVEVLAKIRRRHWAYLPRGWATTTQQSAVVALAAQQYRVVLIIVQDRNLPAHGLCEFGRVIWRRFCLSVVNLASNEARRAREQQDEQEQRPEDLLVHLPF